MYWMAKILRYICCLLCITDGKNELKNLKEHIKDGEKSIGLLEQVQCIYLLNLHRPHS